MRQQLGVIAQQARSALLPSLGALPDGALTYFGISDLTGSKGVGAIATLLNVFAETLTFRLLAKLLLESLRDGKNHAIDGFSNKDKKKLQKVFEYLDRTEHQCFSTEMIKGVSEAVHLLEGDRRLRGELKELIESNKNLNKPFHAAIEELFSETGRLGKLRGVGKLALYGLMSITIFIFSVIPQWPLIRKPRKK